MDVGRRTEQNEMRQGRTGDNDVGRKSKEEERQVSEFTPPHTHNLEVGVAVGRVLLELAGNHGEEQDYTSALIASIQNMGTLVGSLPQRICTARCKGGPCCSL